MTTDYGLRTTDSPAVKWRIIVDEPRSAVAQMACDEQLAREAQPAVRLFVWNPPAVSLGWKQPKPAWLDERPWREAGCSWVERPTGGGLAFHGSDVSVAIVVPRTWGTSVAAMMEGVCGTVVRLCEMCGVQASVPDVASGHERLTYCLAEPAPYAVSVEGRKVAGFALRRYPESWLIQGSLLARPLPDRVAQAMPEAVARRLEERAIALSEACGVAMTEAELAHRWATVWEDAWR